jgi:hypothetical protein
MEEKKERKRSAEKSRRRFRLSGKGKKSRTDYSKLKMFVNGLTLQRTCHGVVKSEGGNTTTFGSLL